MTHTHRYLLPSPDQVEGPVCTGVCACGATIENQRLASAEWQMRDKAIQRSVYSRRTPTKDLAENAA